MSSTNRGSERIPSDFYPTPVSCVENILDNCNIDMSNKRVLEPAAGNGHIAYTIKRKYPRSIVDAIELREEEKLHLTGLNDVIIGDFLTLDIKTHYDIIMTNPPFSLAREFIIRSIELQPDIVIMLLRLSYLESKRRHDFWQKYPVTELYVLSDRPSFTNKGTDSCAYAWFVWYKLNNEQKIYVI